MTSRSSDLNKAWKGWKRHALSYNSWFEFAKDNGATDEEADDLWDRMEESKDDN